MGIMTDITEQKKAKVNAPAFEPVGQQPERNIPL
jgi:hypothetical protein